MKNKLLIIIAAVSLCLPKIIFGQAPSLGTVSQFVIFSSNGAITHTGVGQNSHITGDVGSQIGGTSGFGNVDGVMHNIADGVTASALADLNTVYLDLTAQGSGTLHPPLLGGETLPPGIYSIPVPASPSLGGILTLDGGGDPNAYFLFKLGNDFSTGPASEVKLINGAKACNVFWLVEGTVSIATGTKMRGNIIAHNAAINIATGVLLEGRALSTGGAISVNTGLIATTPIGCGSPVLNGPAAPNLASTACYGIFSSDGPVTDDFASFVTGDVGTNNGSTNGYDPLKVTGAIHPIPDGSTNACATDVGPAYNYLNLIPFDIELLVPSEFGYSLVLTPHVYRTNAAVSFTDTLFLNAQGNPDAVFVFQINGVFATSVNSVVVLQDSAQAKNVFWKIDGAVTINDNSVFKGTIVSAGAITLKTGVNIEGRVLTSVGAISTFATKVIIPVGTCSLNIAPNIFANPVDQTVCAGDSAVFSVTATGTGLNYQWRKGSVNLIDVGNISGATTATLTIYPATALDVAANYNVIVTGDTPPNDTSINVSLTISPATSIDTVLIDQTVCAGDSAGFSVTATGTNLTYQWRKGSVNLVNGGSISGATDSILSINPANITDTAYNYNVIVRGDCGSDTSINVSLTVSSSPTIITQPNNQTVCAGDSAVFTVTATGDSLTYQWRKGLINLIDGGNISGATNDTLIISPATISDVASNYNVVISGVCIGSDTSSTSLDSAGRFGILAGTAITSIGFTVINDLDVGLSPGFRINITGFPPAIVVNGAIYAADDATPVPAMLIQAKQDLTNAYLYAEGASAPAPISVSGDQGGTTLTPGIYKSTSSLLIQSGDLTLDAQGDANAKWIFQIASGLTTIGGAGGNVILTGNAQANNITWQVGSSATIGNGTSFKGNILALTSITMNPGSSIDGRLLARNAAVVLSGANTITSPLDSTTAATSQTISVNVSLTIRPATSIDSVSIDQTVCAGDSAVFSVTATGDSLIYQWRKGTTNLSNGGNISGANGSILSINPVSTSDTASNYNVIVSGYCGKDTSINVSLTVNQKPVALATSNSPVCLGDSIVLSATAVTGATYSWTSTNGYSSLLQNPVILSSTTANNGSYSLTVTANGCTSIPSTIVVVVNDCNIDTSATDFFIPEGFSPNGDGINDLFVIRGILNFPNNSFTIFNRWGNKVFESSPYQNTWDGKCTTGLYIGKDLLPTGTYFYLLDLKDGTDVIKGTIYLNK